MSNWMRCADGFVIRVYGWKKDAERDKPEVFVGFDIAQLCVSATITPDEARLLAKMLEGMADKAEGVRNDRGEL